MALEASNEITNAIPLLHPRFALADARGGRSDGDIGGRVPRGIEAKRLGNRTGAWLHRRRSDWLLETWAESMLSPAPL